MRLNRATFYSAIREGIHKGSLTPKQVFSYEAILDAAEEAGVSDPRHLAYALATTRGEVGSAMQPVPEIGRGKGKQYGSPDPVTGEVYYGRGFVQLTWAGNYKSMGKRLGLDLYRNPDLALDAKTAARILIVGMVEGIFTGKTLSDYLNDRTTDYRNARRIINRLDRADAFARFAELYEQAIRAALVKEKGAFKEAAEAVGIVKPDPVHPSAPASVPPERPRMGAAQLVIGAAAAALAAVFAWVFAGGEP
jgi:putative chitinase